MTLALHWKCLSDANGVNDELENDESDKLAIDITMLGCGWKNCSLVIDWKEVKGRLKIISEALNF